MCYMQREKENSTDTRDEQFTNEQSKRYASWYFPYSKEILGKTQ